MLAKKEPKTQVIFRLDAQTMDWIRRQLASRRPSRVTSVNQMARYLLKEQAGTLNVR